MLPSITITPTAVSSQVGSSKKEISTEDFFNIFTPNSIFPINLRWMDPARRIYVLEYPPETRLISSGEFGETLRRIPLPWQVYVCSVKTVVNVHLTMRTEQLGSLDDILYHSFASNIYRDGTPCGGPQVEGGFRKYKDMEDLELCKQMIDGIWMTNFNGGCYLSSEAGLGNLGKRHRALEDTGRCLLPREVIDAGFDEHFWSYSEGEDDFYAWIEERSIEEVLRWEYHPHATVREIIAHLAAQKESPFLGAIHEIANTEEKRKNPDAEKTQGKTKKVATPN